MAASWDDRVESLWTRHGQDDSVDLLTEMRNLVEERPADDADALYEWASAHDSVGLVDEAIPIYRSSIDSGLAGERQPQAIIQLASSLRVIGDAAAAVELLSTQQNHPVTGDSAQAFLALALHDCGRHDEALRVVLLALAPTLPRYRRSVTNYANDLVQDA